MAALGGLLGAYGSDEEDEEMGQDQPQETQKTGQVTLLGDDESGDGGVDLTHLTSGAAARAAADAETGARAQQQQQQQPARPASAAGERPKDGAGAGEPAAMDGEQLEGAGGGGEQPPAAAGEEELQPNPLAALPPEMRDSLEADCYPDIQARVAHWLHLQRTRGRYINQEIRKSRGYRNPEFFAKMVEHLEIDQYGTSFAPEVFDPKALAPEDYLDALQREWAAEEERRKAARAAGQGRVEFHKSASNPSLVQPALKPGLQQGGQQAPPGVMTAAAIAAKAAAAQQQSQAGISTAAAVAAAQARAAALAAQLASRR